LNPTERYVLINKLILSERYYRDLSDIHEQKIVMLKKDIELYSKQINKYEQNEKEFRSKVKLLEDDKQNLQASNNKLTKQKKRQRDVLLVATGVAIIEGLLLVLLVN
jgi:chromosome segregation ATPase